MGGVGVGIHAWGGWGGMYGGGGIGYTCMWAGSGGGGGGGMHAWSGGVAMQV